MKQWEIIKVSGPLVIAKWLAWAKMYEVVKVSNERLLWEIIELNWDEASIQVYEDTAGIWPWEPVFATWDVMSVEVWPWLLESMYDWVQRPLPKLEELCNSHYIKRWVEAPALDRDR